MRFERKLKSRAGFTLAETMLAVLILVMVASIVASGVPAAKNAYEKVVVAANARVALSTMVTALRNELTTATDVKVDNGNKTVTYYSPERGARSRISLSTGSDKDPAGTIMLQEYLDYADNTEGLFALLGGTEKPTGLATDARRLVSRAASNGDLFIKLEDSGTITASSDAITISGIGVYRKVGDVISGPLAELSTLTIRNITGKMAQTGGE